MLYGAIFSLNVCLRARVETYTLSPPSVSMDPERELSNTPLYCLQLAEKELFDIMLKQ